MSDNQVDLRPPIPPPPAPLKEKSAFDLTNPSLALVIYNFLLAIPFAYLIAVLNRTIIQHLGYEKFIRCPSSILGTRLLFIAVNLFLVLRWAKQMRDEEWKEKVEKEDRMREIRRQVKWWDGEIVRLEGLMGVEKKRQRQLAEAAALEQAEAEFEQQLRTDALLAKIRGSPGFEENDVPSYERDSVVNGDGVKEWDFVVGAKSEKGKEFGKSGHGLKGLSLGSAGSRLPKLKKKKKNVEDAKAEMEQQDQTGLISH
ncbi:hypothetical protein BDZ45DRAFT_728645 [Acephala macrosclerotiorum]|nr:hypothetical protein BDZ45DRAFT_728645 [Acephala macrosclerotiorum]